MFWCSTSLISLQSHFSKFHEARSCFYCFYYGNLALVSFDFVTNAIRVNQRQPAPAAEDPRKVCSSLFLLVELSTARTVIDYHKPCEASLPRMKDFLRWSTNILLCMKLQMSKIFATQTIVIYSYFKHLRTLWLCGIVEICKGCCETCFWPSWYTTCKIDFLPHWREKNYLKILSL